MQRRTTSLATLAGITLVAGLLSAGTAATAAATPRDLAMSPPSWAVPTLAWTDCSDGTTPMECATAEVPTSYRDASGSTTTIALLRLPAAKPDQRIGSLFVNPGGPGQSGVDFIRQRGTLGFSQDVKDRYDIVGFDPRAVGASDPAMCFSSAEEENEVLSARAIFPLTSPDVRTYIAQTKALTDACKANADERISHSSTANVARDLDLLRRAVGEPKLRYVGYSYGTMLGATYAKLFPQNVGSMVLDGTVDPVSYSGANGDPRSVGARTGQGPAAAEAFQQFFDLCRDAAERCALNALGDPETVVNSTLESLKTTSVPIDLGGGPIEVDYPYATAFAFQSLYSPTGFGQLADVFAYLASSGATSLPAAAARALKSAAPDGQDSYPSVGGALASLCVDGPTRILPRDFQRLADAEDRRAPHFGRLRAWVGLECATTSFSDRDAYLGPWNQTTNQEVLVIGTRYDPSTPYANTAKMARTFPRSSVLTVEGYGHTTFDKSTCGYDVVSTYLIEGTTPGRTATCDQDVAPFAP